MIFGIRLISDWDLDVISLHWLGMAIGAGFSISTPLLKYRYSDQDWVKCIHASIHLSGLQFMLIIPLWKENERLE